MKTYKTFITEERDGFDSGTLNRLREYHWRLGRKHQLEGNEKEYQRHNEIGQMLDYVVWYHSDKNKNRVPAKKLPHIDTVP